MAENLTLCDLSDELLQLVAAGLSLEELCHLGRVNKRFQKLVNEGEQLWKRLYVDYFGVCPSASSSSTDWREAFKERYWQALLDEAADDQLILEREMAEFELEQEEDWQGMDGYGSDPEAYGFSD